MTLLFEFIIFFVQFTNNQAILPVSAILGSSWSIWTNLGIKIWWQLQNCGKMTGLLVKRTNIMKNTNKSDVTICPYISNIQVDLGVIDDWQKLRKIDWKIHHFVDILANFYNEISILRPDMHSKLLNSSL